MQREPQNPASEAAAAAPVTVQTRSKYRLIARLARGGMGVVYLAIEPGPKAFDRLLALKELKPDLLEEPTALAMFKEEARLATCLRHPNVVRTLGAGQDGDRHFIVMEFLDGQSLNRIVSRTRKLGGLSLPFHASVLCGALAGLAYAHAAKRASGKPLGIVHRDVSPHNVFVGYDGQVKVLDFGIAKATQSTVETRADILKGKLPYMSPEQAAGLAVDPRADLFSVGVMLWEAVTGRRFWATAGSDTQILQALLHGRLPAERESAIANLPAELRAVLVKATALDPAERHGSANELLDELRAALGMCGAAPHGPADVATFMTKFFAPDRAKVQAAVDLALSRYAKTVSADFPRARPGGRAAAAAASRPSQNPIGSPELMEAGQEIGPKTNLFHASERSESITRAVHKVGSSDVAAALEGLADCVKVVEVDRDVETQCVASVRSPAVRPSIVAAIAVAAAALFGSLAITGWVVSWRSTRPPPAAASWTAALKTPPPDTAAAPPPLPAPVENIRVTVQSSPPQARIVMDGTVDLGNPCVTTLPKNGSTHVVRAEADGYETKQYSFDAGGDVTLVLALEPHRSAPRAAGAPMVPVAPRATSVFSALGSELRCSRQASRDCGR